MEDRRRQRNRRERDVRIDGGTSVPGEMLERRHDAAASHAACESSGKVGDALGILPERARSDNGARAIDREIENGSEIEVRADAAQIVGDLLAELSREIEIVGSADRHHRGHGGDAVAQPGDAPPLLIDGDNRRRVVGVQGAQRIGERARTLDRRQISCEQDVTAETTQRELRAGRLIELRTRESNCENTLCQVDELAQNGSFLKGRNATFSAR